MASKKAIWSRIPPALRVVLIGIPVVATVAVAKPKPKPDEDKLADPPATEVRVTELQGEQAQLTVRSQGTVMPKTEIDLVAQVAGRVTRVEPAFVDGGFFEANALLLEIDPRDYEAALHEAHARVAQARQRVAEERGRAKQAQREWKDLGNQESNDLFLRKPQVAAAEAELQSAEATLVKAELDLERTRITVPFNGRVRDTLVNVGQYVAPGTALASVYDIEVAEIRLPLNDRQASLVNLPLGYAADAQTPLDDDDAPAVTIRGYIGGEAYEWQGRIARTSASIDTRSRMYYAVAEVQDPYLTQSHNTNTVPLVMGLFVEAEIEGKQLDNILVLPRSAVFHRNKVYAVNDDNTVEEFRVELLHADDNQVWVRNTLPNDMRVLTEKQPFVSVGTTIVPRAMALEETPAAEAQLASVRED